MYFTDSVALVLRLFGGLAAALRLVICCASELLQLKPYSFCVVFLSLALNLHPIAAFSGNSKEIVLGF